MSKQDVELLQRIQKGQWLAAYKVFLERTRDWSGLRGLYEFTTHPARRSLLEPAIARLMAVAPVVYGEDADSDKWKLSQGVAFQLEPFGSDHHRLQRLVFEKAARNLWARRVQVWVDGTGENYANLLEHFNTHLNGDDKEFTENPSYNPTSMFCTHFVQTLWVRADSKGRDFDKLLGQSLDLDWADLLMREIRAEFDACIVPTILEYAVGVDELADKDDDLFFDRTRIDEISQLISNSFKLSKPLDVFEGFRRHKVFAAAHRTMLQVAHGGDVKLGVVDLCPRSDGTIDGVSWQIFPAPSREALIHHLWPINQHQGIRERMPADIADMDWRPYLHAYHRDIYERLNRQDPDLLEGVAERLAGGRDSEPFLVLAYMQESISFEDAWHPKCHEWLTPYFENEYQGLVFRLHDVREDRLIPALALDFVKEHFESVAESIVEEQSDSSPSSPRYTGVSLAGLHIIPDWHDGRLISKEQAAFGDAGMRLANRVDDWPEGIEKSFNAEGSKRQMHEDGIRGPAHMLRHGLGTWINQSMTDYGQKLVYQSLVASSPIAFLNSEFIGPTLDQLAPVDRLPLGQFLGSQLVSDIWGWEFSWGVAFALGGARHAAVEVRPSLQERLDHTVVDDSVLGWTLQGPSEMTYVEFGYPILVGNRKFHDRNVSRSIIGAYIWTREIFSPKLASNPVLGEEDAVDLCIAIIGVDKYEGKQTDITPDGWSLPYFKSFKWESVDSTVPVNQLIQRLSQGFAKQKAIDNEKYASTRVDTWDTSSERESEEIGELRLDEITFETTMASIAKVLLYMGLRDARVEHEDRTYSSGVGRGVHPVLKPLNKERKEVRDALKGKSSILHKIRVGPVRFDDDEIDEKGTGEKHGGTAKRPHYRVGHFRMQACGPGWRDRNRIWLKPQLIGRQGLLGGSPRLYDVG